MLINFKKIPLLGRFLGSKDLSDEKVPVKASLSVEEALAAMENNEAASSSEDEKKSPEELLLGNSEGQTDTPSSFPDDEGVQPFENEVQEKRRSSKLKVLLIILLALIFVWAGIKVVKRLLFVPQGPALTKLTKKKESLYCPLGFPLSGQRAHKELQQWGVNFEITPEGFLQGTTPGMTIFAESTDVGFTPRSLQVWSKDVPVKWGLGISVKEKELQIFLGTPEEISGDCYIYKDRWENTLIYTIQENKVTRIEWYYPKGLTFPKK